MYAAGKIPGGFFKREGRQGEKAILTARMIDRPIRPLWPKGYRNEVQCIVTVLSADMVVPYDILAINGVSAALMLSPMPFLGPIGAVRARVILDPRVERLARLRRPPQGVKEGRRHARAADADGVEHIRREAPHRRGRTPSARAVRERSARPHRRRAGLEGAEEREAAPALRADHRDGLPAVPGRTGNGRRRARRQGLADEELRQEGGRGGLQ